MKLLLQQTSTPSLHMVTVSGSQSGVSTNVTSFLVLPPQNQSFTHDADGNLTSDSNWTLTWNAENRLIAAEGLAGQTLKRLELEYDHLGRRIRKKVFTPGAPSWVLAEDHKFVYDGWNLIAELDGSNTPLRTMVWGLDLSGSMQGAGGVGGLLMIKPAGMNTQLPAYEGNGNVMGLVDANTGSMGARYDYGPFGEPLRMRGTVELANPFRWSTKYTDDETGFVYYGHRYYDPIMARWTSRDPIGEEGGVNLYGFCENDSIMGIDRLGLVKWSDLAQSSIQIIGGGIGVLTSGAIAALPLPGAQLLAVGAFAFAVNQFGSGIYNVTTSALYNAPPAGDIVRTIVTKSVDVATNGDPLALEWSAKTVNVVEIVTTCGSVTVALRQGVHIATVSRELVSFRPKRWRMYSNMSGAWEGEATFKHIKGERNNNLSK